MAFSNLMGTMDRSRLNLPQHRIPTYEATLSRTSSTSTLTNEKQQLSHTDSVSEKHTSGIGAITGEEKVRPTAVIETIFQWALKIIGVASAIVFGVWAPISYRLQQDGNKSNDETQEVLISRMTDLIERVDDLERSLREIGRLKAMEVCSNDEHKPAAVCRSLAKEQDLEKIISDVVKGDQRATHVPSQRREMYTMKPTSAIVPLTTASVRHDELRDELPHARVTGSSAAEESRTTSPPDLSLLPPITKGRQTGSDSIVASALGILAGVMMVGVCGFYIVRRTRRILGDEGKEGVRRPLLGD